MIIIIAALDLNRLIGVNNKMPWNIKSEMAHFRQQTTGHTVLMGRNTYEGIGRALPNRRNIVVTSRPLYNNEVEVINDLDAFLKAWPKGETLYVMGGAKIYESSLKYADVLLLSLVKGTYIGDTYFPQIPPQFSLKSVTEHDEFSVQRYVR